MKKVILILVLVVLLAGDSFYAFSRNSKQVVQEGGSQQAPVSQNSGDAGNSSTTETKAPETTTTTKPAVTTTTKPKVVQGTYSDGSEAEGMGADVLVVEVSFDGSKYTPSSVDIKAGDIVIFRNNGGKNFLAGFLPASSAFGLPRIRRWRGHCLGRQVPVPVHQGRRLEIPRPPHSRRDRSGQRFQITARQ